MAGTTIATSISTLLGGLTPGQFGKLVRHMTQSDAARAMQIIMTMESNPALAPALLPTLLGIPNLPPAVTTWTTAGLANPANFQQDMAQAMAALQQAMTQPGLLGNLGL